jgi:hypothetical protein
MICDWINYVIMIYIFIWRVEYDKKVIILILGNSNKIQK